MSLTSVLLVEDSDFDGRMICKLLETAGYGQFLVTRVEQLAAGIQGLKEKAFDVVILDLNLPDSVGMATFLKLQAEFPHIPIIIWTAEQDVELAVLAVSQGAQDYIVKGDISGRLLIRNLRYGIERKRAEQNFRQLMDTVPVGIIIANKTGHIVDANAQILGTFGYERDELIGKSVEILVPETLRSAHEKHRGSYRSSPHARAMGIGMELVARKKDGTEFPVEIGLGPLTAQGETLVSAAIVDITARKKMEEQLRVSQRMEAIGRLAGGVAHDFNNLLTIILGCCDALAEDLGADPAASKKIETMRKAGASAADLTRQLLAFGRKQMLQPKLIEPKEIVNGVAGMLRRLIGENIRLEISANSAVGCINADPGQVEQILVNLAANARDAMPDGGRLTIEVANAELDETYKKQHPPAIPGPYVMIGITDTGCGMDRETQSQIFDPFFTTKEFGKGTGLGLAMVYGIVKQSGGYIWVYSELGKGTVFKVYLPRIEREAPQNLHADPDGAPQRGSETILVAEDSESLREMAREYMESLGYTVIEAASGTEALQRFNEFEGVIHLLLTDVVMPEMNGRELADQIVRKRPGIKILFTSGYTDDAIVRHGVLEPGIAFIQKPYRPRALARKIREVLDNSPAPPSPITTRNAITNSVEPTLKS
jgi:two-component system, cell cycle sensor histidine kinase and response regulator CckA